ncbi:MOB kinase activator-like 2 [Anopheles cruzii]|uniref:MOB kinase activator-like 2 n=1 Tax=Anopheles cruzii TaxID=68878 RepID=UPI0022EC62C5|nr:MOB kinase activator-like 2 [Anopheles cruzii]
MFCYHCPPSLHPAGPHPPRLPTLEYPFAPTHPCKYTTMLYILIYVHFNNGGFRPVLDNGQPRTTPPLFLPPHLASLSSQFNPPLFPSLKAAFPGLCSCCPAKVPATSSGASSVSPSCTSSSTSHSPSSAHHHSTAGSALSAITSSVSGTGLPDPRSSSVAELRRKAQEHSAALLHSLQAAAAAGLAFPGFHLPPLSLHSALSSGRKPSDFISDLSMHHHHHHHLAAGAHHLSGHLASLHQHHHNNNNSTAAANNNTSSTNPANHSPSAGSMLATDVPRSPRTHTGSGGHEKSDSNE